MHHSDPLSSASLLSDTRRRVASVDQMRPRSSSLGTQRANNTRLNSRRSSSFVAHQRAGTRGQSSFQSYHCPPSASSTRGLHHGPYKPPADEPLLRAVGRVVSDSVSHFGRQKSAASLAITVSDESGLADAVRWGLDVSAMLAADIALYRKKVGGGESTGMSKDLSVFYSSAGVEGACGGMSDFNFGLSRVDKNDTESSGTAGYPFLFSSHVPFAESGAAQRRSLLTVGNASARTRSARCSTSDAVGGSGISAPTVTGSAASTSVAFRHPIITPSERATFDEDLMRSNYHRQETLFFSTVLPAAQALARRRSRRETHGDGSGTSGPLDLSARGNTEEQRRAKKKQRASRRHQESDQATHSPKPQNPNPNPTDNNNNNNGPSWEETILSPLTPAARRQVEESEEENEVEKALGASDPTRTPTRSSPSSSKEDADYDSNKDSSFSSSVSSSLSSNSSMISPHKDHTNNSNALPFISPHSRSAVAVSHVDSVLASLHPIRNGGGNKAVDTKNGSIGFIPSANVLFTPSPCPLRAVLYEANPMSSRHMNSATAANNFSETYKGGTESHQQQLHQSINDTASFHVVTRGGIKGGEQMIETGRGSGAAAAQPSSSLGGHTPSSSPALNSAAVSPIPKFAHTTVAARRQSPPQLDQRTPLHSQQELHALHGSAGATPPIWDSISSKSANDKSYWSSRSHAIIGNSTFWDASTSLLASAPAAGSGGAPRPVATSYATAVTINGRREDATKQPASSSIAASNSIEEELSYSDLHTHRLIREGSSAQQKRAMTRVRDGSLLSPPPPLPSSSIPTLTSAASTLFGDGKSVSIMNASVESAQQHRAKRDRADVQNSRRIVAMAENGVDHMANLVLRGCGDDAIGVSLLDSSGRSSSLLNNMPTPTLAALRACPTEIFVRYFFQRMNLAPLLGLSEQFRRVVSEGARSMGGTSLLEEGGHSILNGQCVWQMLQIVFRSLQEALLRILEACEKEAEDEESNKERGSARQSSSVRQRLEVLYRVLFADEVEAHFAPSFGDLWRKANTAAAAGGESGGKQRPPPLSLLQKHRLVLAHISTGAAVIARAVPSSKARRMSAELKRVATGSSSASLQSAADRESGDSNTLAKMWSVVADLLAVFFVILLPTSPPALAEGQHMRGMKGRGQREGGHDGHLVSIQTIGLEQLSLLPPPHSAGAAVASSTSFQSSYPSLSSHAVTASYLSVFPSADYYTYDELKALDAALCRFLMELQVLPEPHVVPSLRPLLQNAVGGGVSSVVNQKSVNNSTNANRSSESFVSKREGGGGGDLSASSFSSSSSQVIIDCTVDPLAAPFIPESLAYGGLSSSAAYRASYGSLTPGVTGHIVGSGKGSSRGNSHFADEGDEVGYTAATSLRQSLGFTPRSTPLSSILDPTVFPYLRNGTLLCDIAAKLIGDVAGGRDLFLNFASSSVVGGSSTAGGRGGVGGFATAPENRLTTVQSKQKTTNEGAAGPVTAAANGSAARPPLRFSSSSAVSSSPSSLSLSSFTRNPRVEKACLVNINLALKLLSSSLSKGSVAKRLAMAGGLLGGGGATGTSSGGTVRGMCSDSAFLGGEGGRGVSKGLGLFSLSAISKSLNSSLNPSDAGLGLSAVPSSSATASLSLLSSGNTFSASSSYLAPYCLHDAVRIFEGDVHLIMGLLEDIMRYAFGEPPRGLVQQKGGAGVGVGGAARVRAEGGGGPFIPYRFRDSGSGGRGVSVPSGVDSSGVSNTASLFGSPPHEPSKMYHSLSGENGIYSRSTATNGRQSTTNKTVLNSYQQQWQQQEHSQYHAAHNTNPLHVKRGAVPNSSGDNSEFRGAEGGGTTTMLKRETQQPAHTVSPARASGDGSGGMSPPLSAGTTKREKGTAFPSNGANNESAADKSNTDYAAQTSFRQAQHQQQNGGDHSRRGGNVIDLKANPHMSYLAAIPPTSDEECAELGAWLARKLGPRYTHTAHDGSFSIDFGQCLGLAQNSGTNANGSSGSGPRSIILNSSWFVGGTCHLGGTVMLAANSITSTTAMATATNQRGGVGVGGAGGQTPSKERGQGKCWLFSDGVVLYDLAKVLVYNNSSKLRGPLLGSVSTKVSAPAAKKHNIRLVLRFLAEEKRLGVGKHGVGMGLSGDGGSEVNAVDGGGPHQPSSSELLRLLSKTSASIANAPSLEDALVAGDLRAVVMVLREVRWAFRTHVEGGPPPAPSSGKGNITNNTNVSYSNRSSSTSSAIMGHSRVLRSGSVSTAAGDGRPSSQIQHKNTSNGSIVGVGVGVPNTMPRARRGSSQSFSNSQIEETSLRRDRSSSAAAVPPHKSSEERGTPSQRPQRQQPQQAHKSRVVASGHSFSSASSPLSHNTNNIARSSSSTTTNNTNKINGTSKTSDSTTATSAVFGAGLVSSSSTAAERVVAMAAKASSLLLGGLDSSRNINHRSQNNQKESESKRHHTSPLIQTADAMREADNSHRNEEANIHVSRGRNARLGNPDADEGGSEEDDDDATTSSSSSSSSFFVKSNNNNNNNTNNSSSAASLSVAQAFASLESHRFTTPVQELIGLGLEGRERDGGVKKEEGARKTSGPHTNTTAHGRKSERRSASDDAMGPPLDFFVPVGARHGRRGSESAPYGELGFRGEGEIFNAFPSSNSQHLEFEVRPPSYPSGLSTPLRTWM